MVGTLTQSGAVLLKAGTNVSSDLTGTGALGQTADDIIVSWINEAESHICAETKVNWIDIYSTLDADLKKVLDAAASAWASERAINYDMSGYTSRAEAQTMLNVNYTIFTDSMKILKEKVNTDFIQGV